MDPAPVPRASEEPIHAAIAEAVTTGKVWLLSGPASLLSESIPTGVLTPAAKLRIPPAPLPAAAILPENLPGAWQNGSSTALAIAASLSQETGRTLPWKTVRDVISGALQARFIRLSNDSSSWPCELSSAGTVRIQAAETGVIRGSGEGVEGGSGAVVKPNLRAAAADFEPSQIQDLGELIPELLQVKAKSNIPMKFHVRLEIGDGDTPPSEDVVKKINDLLQELDPGFRIC